MEEVEEFLNEEQMEEHELRLYFRDEGCIQHSAAKASNHIQVLQLMQVGRRRKTGDEVQHCRTEKHMRLS